jgi:hypothetical protein
MFQECMPLFPILLSDVNHFWAFSFGSLPDFFVRDFGFVWGVDLHNLSQGSVLNGV